jgi:hypothetical protein
MLFKNERLVGVELVFNNGIAPHTWKTEISSLSHLKTVRDAYAILYGIQPQDVTVRISGWIAQPNGEAESVVNRLVDGFILDTRNGFKAFILRNGVEYSLFVPVTVWFSNDRLS